jgi:glycosyltransferase involved in cell wall biosynthesis
MARIAVIIPCLNEEESVGRVIQDFRQQLPTAGIYVFDNGSSDKTVIRAEASGAIVRTVDERGKGNVVRRAFADVDSDVYILVDGDDTYDSGIANEMAQLVLQTGVDLVTASRTPSSNSPKARLGHELGNTYISRLVRFLFRSNEQDVLSGYRALSRRFVKSFPTTASGFEIEVQMTAHASLLRVRTQTVSTEYRERSNGGSKLKTVRDGIRIVLSVFRIYRAYAPSRFFGTFSLFSLVAGGLVFACLNRSSTSTLLAAGLLLFGSLLLFVVGVVLNGISRIQYQQLRLAFLGQRALID